MNQRLAGRLRAILGTEPVRIQSLHGGCVGEVYRVDLADGSSFVAKLDDSSTPRLDIEEFMLGYLAEHGPLPVPRVFHSESSLLVMEFIPGESRFDRSAQEHAAELLAALHGVRADRFGFERDTLIGGLPQSNAWTISWIEFFATHRLRNMAAQALAARRLGRDELARVDTLIEKLPMLIDEPTHPSLLHGDAWTTNVLAADGKISAFLDPAIYYGHTEIELAFITLFGTFGEPFFKRYGELRPIAPGFFELRRDIYNLYPLLVHVRLFGGGYLDSVRSILRRHGC